MNANNDLFVTTKRKEQRLLNHLSRKSNEKTDKHFICSEYKNTVNKCRKRERERERKRTRKHTHTTRKTMTHGKLNLQTARKW